MSLALSLARVLLALVVVKTFMLVFISIPSRLLTMLACFYFITDFTFV